MIALYFYYMEEKEMTVKELRQKLCNVQEQDAEVTLHTLLDREYPDKSEWDCTAVGLLPMDGKIVLYGV